MIATPNVLLIVFGLAGAPPVEPVACVANEIAVPAQPADRCFAPEIPDSVVTHEQFDTIMEWLAQRFDLPKSSEYPAIVIENPANFGRMQRGGLVTYSDTQRGNEAEHRSGGGDILAFYNNAKRTIHFSEDWSGNTDAGMSVLVHEMVHHLQNMAGLKYNCVSEREKLAYQAQAAWLERSGKSLESEFGLDPLTLLVRSNCM